MKHAVSFKPTQPRRALVLLAALGFTALVGLAALEPAVQPARSAPSTDNPQLSEFDPALRAVEPAVLPSGSSPHFERENEPAIEANTVNAHGG